MAALLPTALHFTGDRLIAQGNQHRRGTDRAPLRISCSKPASTGPDSVAAVRDRESDAKRESRSRAAKAAATKMEDSPEQRESGAESEWDVFCDILPDSRQCQTTLLHLTSSCQTGEMEAEAAKLGSKKPLRLSFASWDLLD